MTDLYKTRNWRGILALEATASAAAAQLRETVPDLAAIIYRMLGCGFHRLGQTNKAIGLCEQGLALAEEAGDRACTWMICDSLGGCHETLGQYAKAIKLHEQSLAIAEEMGNRVNQGSTCTNLGVCYERLGQYDTGIGLLDKAKLINQEVGDRGSEVTSLAGLGRCKIALGKYEQAVTYQTKRYAIALELDLKHDQSSAALHLGVCVWAQARVAHHDATDSTTPIASGHPAAYMDSMREAALLLRTAICLARVNGVGSENMSARV